MFVMIFYEHSKKRFHEFFCHIFMRKQRFWLLWVSALLTVDLLVVMIPAWAWGPGHDDIQKGVLAHLPGSFQGLDRAFQDDLVRVVSHYPDSFEPFESARIGEASLARLAAWGIHKRYDLHSPKGRAVAFLEMAQALREGEKNRANFWLAAFAHSVADMAAVNHDPLVHVATYGWGDKKQGISLMGPAKVPVSETVRWLDLAATARDPAGAKVFQKKIEEARIADDGSSLEARLLEMMLYGYTGAEFAAPRGLPILEAAFRVAQGEPPKESGLYIPMAEVGSWAVARALRDARSAERFAASSEVVLEISDALLRKYDQAVEAHLRSSKLLDSALFQLPASRQAAEDLPAIGIVVEPTWEMNAAFLGFAQRIHAVEIANALFRGRRPFRLLDVRALLKEGVPNPSLLPVLILPVADPSSLGWMKTGDLARRLLAYSAAGGRILWVGDRPPLADVFPELVGAMRPSSDKSWPLPVAEMQNARLELPRGASWALARPLETAAGWQRPKCPYVFDAEQMRAHPDLTPVLNLAPEDGSPITVGVAWPGQQPRVVFLPTYALTPFLFSSQGELPASPAEISLDETGVALLNRALDLLQAPSPLNKS